jgi:hypothetical protein
MMEWSAGVQLACLMHDCHEAYIGDISTPVKLMVPEIKVFEHRVEVAFHRAMGIVQVMTVHAPNVKQADVALLLAEKKAMIPNTSRPWAYTIDVSQEFPYSPISYGTAGPEEFYKCLLTIDDVLPLALQQQTIKYYKAITNPFARVVA